MFASPCLSTPCHRSVRARRPRTATTFHVNVGKIKPARGDGWYFATVSQSRARLAGQYALRVASMATHGDIQQAHRALIRELHPGHGGGSTSAAMVNVAGRAHDPVTRAEYEPPQSCSRQGRRVDSRKTAARGNTGNGRVRGRWWSVGRSRPIVGRAALDPDPNGCDVEGPDRCDRDLARWWRRAQLVSASVADRRCDPDTRRIPMRPCTGAAVDEPPHSITVELASHSVARAPVFGAHTTNGGDHHAGFATYRLEFLTSELQRNVLFEYS